MHAAERLLLDAAHRAEVAGKTAAIMGYFASLLSAAEARIIAHVQGRVALLSPSLSLAERVVAIERLQAEQAAALSRLRQDIGQERRQARSSGVASLVAGHRTRRRALSHRRAAERVASAVMIGIGSTQRLAKGRKRTSVRHLATRIVNRMGQHAPRGPVTL